MTLGATPKPGFLDWLPLGLLGSEPDRFGFSKYPLGIWRRQWEGFSALAFNRDLLANVSPHLRVEETETAAQLRVQVKDLTGTKLSDLLEATKLFEFDRQDKAVRVRKTGRPS